MRRRHRLRADRRGLVMSLDGPLPRDVVGRWVAAQLEHAPEHLTVDQRRVIRNALREVSTENTLDHQYDQPRTRAG